MGAAALAAAAAVASTQATVGSACNGKVVAGARAAAY